MDSKESIFDEHVNCVSDNIERLEQIEDLVATTEPVMFHASDKGNGRPGVRLITEAEHLSRRLHVTGNWKSVIITYICTHAKPPHWIYVYQEVR